MLAQARTPLQLMRELTVFRRVCLQQLSSGSLFPRIIERFVYVPCVVSLPQSGEVHVSVRFELIYLRAGLWLALCAGFSLARFAQSSFLVLKGHEYTTNKCFRPERI